MWMEFSGDDWIGLAVRVVVNYSDVVKTQSQMYTPAMPLAK